MSVAVKCYCNTFLGKFYCTRQLTQFLIFLRLFKTELSSLTFSIHYNGLKRPSYCSEILTHQCCIMEFTLLPSEFPIDATPIPGIGTKEEVFLTRIPRISLWVQMTSITNESKLFHGRQ